MAIENRDAAIAAISTCKTRSALNAELARYHIADAREAVDCLNECMGSPQKFYSQQPASPEDELEFTKQIFLTGGWRLNALYDRVYGPMKRECVVA
jgi:hypothetical protein